MLDGFAGGPGVCAELSQAIEVGSHPVSDLIQMQMSAVRQSVVVALRGELWRNQANPGLRREPYHTSEVCTSGTLA